MNHTTTSGDLLGLGIDNVTLLVGALIGVLGSLLVLGIRLQIRKRRLRKALREEIRTMATDIHRYAASVSVKDPEGIEVPPDTLVLTVYESNTSDLGLLGGSEVQEITQFYTLVQNTKQRLSALSDTSEPSVPELRLIQRDLIRLNNRKNTVISMLEDKIWWAESSEESSPEIYSDIDEPEYDPVDFLDSQLDDEDTTEESIQ